MSAERAALVAIEAIARSALYAETRVPIERDSQNATPPRSPTACVSSEIATALGNGQPSNSVTAAAARAAAAFGELAEAVERAVAKATR